MKKWFIILSIIFTVGLISSAILAGSVYYTDLKTYEDYDKKELQIEASENISIESVIPVEIHPTTGIPYAEFTQTFVDLAGLAPKYELEVEQQNNHTYIRVNKVQEALLSIGVKAEEAKLVVYLPQIAINRLSIDGPSYYTISGKKQIINLDQINVNELKINVAYTDFNLNGAYDTVEISAHNGILNMNSTQPADVYISGDLEQHLNGLYEKLEIRGGSSNNINIESTQASTVKIDSYSCNIRLKGKYHKINILGSDNNIELESATECKLITEGMDNMIYANGAFKVLDLEEVRSEIEVQTTVIPQSIQMVGIAQENVLELTLPSNIPGFRLSYINNENSYNEAYNYYDNSDFYEEDRQEAYNEIAQEMKNIQSDFMPITIEDKNGELIHQYADGTVPIRLNKEANFTLKLMDGGYSSTIENK